MKTILHKAGTRGFADHGWLKAHHSFSFANYYNAERMHFGVLRVLNDDVIEGGKGFGMHPHENMEIITIPLVGDLEHKDNMGNTSVIKHGDVQVMSAGSGIYHSEYNYNADKGLSLFQIWLFPNKKNVEPRYDQVSIREISHENRLYQILSPNKDDQGVWIHQDAWFHLGNFKSHISETYELKRSTNGVYIIVINGEIEINGMLLSKRDAIGIWETEKVEMKTLTNANVLVMEVPMQIK
jgi:redox-sensitive bicupin YhaK (pirin superfamily)